MDNKKGGALLHLFSPNLTMNLTYLCYGPPNIDQTITSKKGFRRTSESMVEMRFTVFSITIYVRSNSGHY